MSLHITYFVHGTTTDNQNKLASGWNDVPLSDLGIEQAKNLGELTRDQLFEAVYSSDLSRAHLTAKIAFGERLRIITDSRLRECNYGEYSGQAAAYVDEQLAGSIDRPLPHGESCLDVEERVSAFLQDMKRNHEGKRVAVVSHRVPQLALDVLLKGMSWEEAFAHDWRNEKKWQPGWEYVVE